MLRILVMAGYLLLLTTTAAMAGVGEPAPASQRAAALAAQIESPFCPGRTLDTCTSPSAAAWRTDIRTWVDEGVASKQIKARLSKRANRNLSIVPENNTFSLLLSLGALAGIFGFGVVMRMARRGKETMEEGTGPEETVKSELTDEALEEFLNDELAQYD